MDQRFAYEVDRRFLPLLLPLGFVPSRQAVEVGSGRLRASLGPVRLETPLSNVSGAHITGGYRWWTSVGIRLSFADDGLTFGTNPKAGVCIHFREKVPTVVRRKGHSALTVTVADLHGLVDLLGPEDAR